MRELTAQVTSSLLPFPAVTIDALGEDEITLDSVLQGKLTGGRSGLAWLACGPQLEVVHAVTGERMSAYCFSGGGEHPPSILAARDFSWLKRSGLLVGLEEAEGSVLCLYDLGLSRVVKAVVIPGRVTAIEPLVSYGGASTSTQHLHQSLRWFFGIAAVVTDLGHVLLLDLCLDDLSCSQSELEASDLEVVTKSPAEIPRLREAGRRQGRHLCLQLNGPSGTRATALQYLPRTNQLAVGFSDGYLQLWNMKTLKKEYHSQLEGGRVPVYAFTFQEPENDPRNCCYLWAVQSAQDLEGDVVSLHLLQLAFSERKCLASGKTLYEGLEYCEERYIQELSTAAFPLRAQASSTRLLSCQTIEKFRAHTDRDDSMNEAASPDTSVSFFSWQVKAYGQSRPSTYVGVFDINRWYHAQMPDSLRVGESLHSCPYLAVWSLDPIVEMVSPRPLLDVLVHERSLSRGLPVSCPPPEHFFNPTTYNFDATCLFNSGIVHLTCSGYQKQTLSFLKRAAPCSSDVISSSYSRCLMSGLLSSRPADTRASNLSQEEQLDAILSTAVETSSLGLITGCIRQWTAEEQPGSALNLRYILEWAWNKVVHTKEELDNICAPLFDSSSNFTDPQTLLLLQHNQRLLGNLSTIFHCLLSQAQELTQRGLIGLVNKHMVSNLISQYAQVVLWFCRTGLLPEGSDEDALQISRPYYSHSVINNYYTIRREELTRLAKGKWCADCLMIDGLVGQCGERLVNLWKRDEGGTGQYPPPTLHALLDIYLLENIDEAAKHAIVIYLLLDVMYAFPNKGGASVESFPTAFAIPIGLVKLVQGLWLLDHRDHQSSVERLLHPTTSLCQFAWQHERILQALMCQGQHMVALRYLHLTKPPLSSTAQAKLCLSVLLHNRCLVEAWTLLRQHSSRLNMDELLGFLFESCQELGLMKELLKLPLSLAEQECMERFLQGTGGLQNRELLMVHFLQQANYIPALQLNQSLKMNHVNERDPKLKERSMTRNSILDQYSKVLPRVQRKLAMERAKPYQHPSAIHKEVSRPKPLSTIAKRSANEKAMSRAGFINNVLTKIEEVWLGNGTPPASPAKRADRRSPSPKPCSLSMPEAFLGTPITMTAKRKSRLLDLVVHPSCQSPLRLPSSWAPPKSIINAPELSLLQTPDVVKRARVIAASGPVFSAFTPQSILRSSLRPTPVATPSASPGRSITPPLLHTKESRITFIEEEESPEAEKDAIRWSNGIPADSEISLLTRGSPLPKTTRQTWSSQPPEDEEEEENGEEDEEEEEEVEELKEEPRVKFLPPEGGVPSPQPEASETEMSSAQEVTASARSSGFLLPGRLSLGLETSQASIQSTDTTLEFHDAPLPEEMEEEPQQPANKEEEEDDDDVVVVNVKAQPEEEGGPPPEEKAVLTLEAEQSEGQEVMEGQMAEEQEEEMEVCVEPEAEQQEEETVEQASSQQEDNPTSDLEVAQEPAEPKEQTTDLTEFVERYLFGDDPSPQLTRSGIHDRSHTWPSYISESVGETQEVQPAPEAPPALSSQKSVTSLTSSETTSTDSHSVVSVHDSEELSSAASEEEEEKEDDEEDEDEEEDEEEEDEEEEEQEEEDSGSEVEIIEEVQGNGRLQPDPPPPRFLGQSHPHYLPSLSEQDAAVLSLVTPEAELKMLEGEMEGEVVMVRLGEDGGLERDQTQEDNDCYTELKPSTTLLVPLELVEGQEHGLVDTTHLGLAELGGAGEPEAPAAQSSFSLMLEVNEDEEEHVDADADTLPMENDVEPYDHSSPQPPAKQEASDDEPAAQPEVILLGTDDQDPPVSEATPAEDQAAEMDTLEELIMAEPVVVAEDHTSQAEETEELIMAEPVVVAEDHTSQAEETEELKMAEPVVEAEDNTSQAEETEELIMAEPVVVAEDHTSQAEETEELIMAEPVVEAEDHTSQAEEPEELEMAEPVVVAEDPTSQAEELIMAEPVVVAEDHTSLAGEPEELKMAEPVVGAEDMDTNHTEEPEELKMAEPVVVAEDHTSRAEEPEELEMAEPVVVAEDRTSQAGEPEELEMAEPVVVAEDHSSQAEEPEDLEMAEPVVGAEDMDTNHTEEPEELKMAEPVVEAEDHTSQAEEPEELKMAEPEVIAEEHTEEPKTPSASESALVEKPSLASEEKGQPSQDNGAMKDSAVEEEDMPSPAEDQRDAVTGSEDVGEVVPVSISVDEVIPTSEEDRPAEMEGSEPEQRTEAVVPVIEDQEPTEEEEQGAIEEPMEEEQKRGGEEEGEKEDGEEEDRQPEPQPAVHTTTTTSERVRKPPATPTQRSTRGRTMVTFISPIFETETGVSEVEGRPEEPERDSQIPASPGRVTRSGRVSESTPRRGARKSHLTPLKEKEVEEKEEDAVGNDDNTAPVSTRAPTSAKRQKATPRRASRRTWRTKGEAPTATENVEEEMEEEVFAPPVTRSARKTRAGCSDSQQPGQLAEEAVEVKQPGQLAEEEAEEVKQPAASPARRTRKSSHVTLNLTQVEAVTITPPRSRRKRRGEGTSEKTEEQKDAPPLAGSRRPTRSKLWNHPEEDLPLLDTPLEVDSGTPVADALIKRLRDEEEKDEVIGEVVRETVRANKRSVESSAKQAPPPPVSSEDSLVPEPNHDQPSADKHSFIYAPPHRRARGRRAESLVQSEEVFLPPTTRSRTSTAATLLSAQDENAVEDDVDTETAVSKVTKRTIRRTVKPKSTLTPPIVTAKLISLPPSPVQPEPHPPKRSKDVSKAPSKAPAASHMSLRRKRIMDAVFTKPATRRRKL